MKDPAILIRHVLDAIVRKEEYTKELTKVDFENNFLVQDAVLRNIILIDEAAKNIPEEFKQEHAVVEWRKIVGMRNKVVHEYFIIDVETVWNVVQRDLPQLKLTFSKLLNR
ncbi:MAG: DUF86 domain-containing protein [Cyclobacteriaceae bacterium]|nr:DUF86 domain-containing protein [Cyclobacteriaceae bacterium]